MFYGGGSVVVESFKKLIQFFGMFMESWILGVSCKVSEARSKRPEVFMIPVTDQKLNLLLIFTSYYKYLKIQKLFII